jgi:hypothetical protein
MTANSLCGAEMKRVKTAVFFISELYCVVATRFGHCHAVFKYFHFNIFQIFAC